MSPPSAKMSPRPIDEATIRSDVIGDAHDPWRAVRGSAMRMLSNSRFRRRIRWSEQHDVKHCLWHQGLNGRSRSFVIRPLFRRRVEVKIVLALTAALLLNLSSPVHAQMPPGAYPGAPPGPGYPSPEYQSPPPGAGQWPSCDQLAQAEPE